MTQGQHVTIANHRAVYLGEQPEQGGTWQAVEFDDNDGIYLATPGELDEQN